MNKHIEIPLGPIKLKGILTLPRGASTIVIFAHGSGSGRLSPRNQLVAKLLNNKNLATLLFDLLTEDEEVIDTTTAQFRFNIELLAKRLDLVVEWITKNPDTKNLSISLFGASTGAAAALVVAAHKPIIKAVVSRGGRPDLAKASLSGVKAATLLIVGGNDTLVIELNKQAFQLLKGEKKLEIVEGASHLFEERGKLEEVGRLASEWFLEKK